MTCPAGSEVLLQLRGPETTYMAGHWATAAAGHVEAGESVLEAAVREAREELGVEVDPAALTPLCAMHRTDPGNPAPIEQRVDFFFTARDWSGEPSIQEPGKCVDLRWVSARRPAGADRAARARRAGAARRRGGPRRGHLRFRRVSGV